MMPLQERVEEWLDDFATSEGQEKQIVVSRTYANIGAYHLIRGYQKWEKVIYFRYDHNFVEFSEEEDTPMGKGTRFHLSGKEGWDTLIEFLKKWVE